MKFKSIRIKNFQSIKDLKIEFEENGIFRFTGPNNIGKSAFLKAMAILMRNVSNRNYKDYIRDDEDTFEIRGEDFKGNWVHLSRGLVDFYSWNINGKKGRLDKTKGKVPLEVEQYFNLYIEKEKTKACLNIRLPREVLMFIDTTDGDNAMIVQKALGTEEYMLGIKMVDKKAREINKEVKLIEKYLEQESNKLEDIERQLFDTKKNVEDIERYEDTLQEEYDSYLVVDVVIELTENVVDIGNTIKKKNNILQKLELNKIEEDIDLLSELKSMEELLLTVEELENTVKNKKEKIEDITLEGIEDEIETVESMYGMYDSLKELSVLKNNLSKKKESYDVAKSDFEVFKEKIGVCPLCGGDMDSTHVH